MKIPKYTRGCCQGYSGYNCLITGTDQKNQYKGIKGDKGDSGPPGPQGIQGPRGHRGIPGKNALFSDIDEFTRAVDLAVEAKINDLKEMDSKIKIQR